MHINQTHRTYIRDGRLALTVIIGGVYNIVPDLSGAGYLHPRTVGLAFNSLQGGVPWCYYYRGTWLIHIHSKTGCIMREKKLRVFPLDFSFYEMDIYPENRNK